VVCSTLVMMFVYILCLREEVNRNNAARSLGGHGWAGVIPLDGSPSEWSHVQEQAQIFGFASPA